MHIPYKKTTMDSRINLSISIYKLKYFINIHNYEMKASLFSCLQNIYIIYIHHDILFRKCLAWSCIKTRFSYLQM